MHHGRPGRTTRLALSDLSRRPAGCRPSRTGVEGNLLGPTSPGRFACSGTPRRPETPPAGRRNRRRATDGLTDRGPLSACGPREGPVQRRVDRPAVAPMWRSPTAREAQRRTAGLASLARPREGRPTRRPARRAVQRLLLEGRYRGVDEGTDHQDAASGRRPRATRAACGWRRRPPRSTSARRRPHFAAAQCCQRRCGRRAPPARTSAPLVLVRKARLLPGQRLEGPPASRGSARTRDLLPRRPRWRGPAGRSARRRPACASSRHAPRFTARHSCRNTRRPP